MNLESLSLNRSEGFSLIELILSLALFVVSIASIAHLFVGARSTAFYSLNKSQASFLAKEGIEEQRALGRQDGIRNLKDKEETITLDGKDFQREIDVTFLTRNRAKVTSTVTQTFLGQEDELSFSEVFTTWNTVENSLDFDGEDDAVQINDYKGVTGDKERTTTLWFKSNVKKDHMLIAWGLDSTGEKYTIRIYNGEYLRIENDGGQKYDTDNIVTDGEWHHLAIVFPEDGDGVQDHDLYIDGELAANTDGSDQSLDTAEDSDVYIGNPIWDHEYLEGEVDSVMIYDRALSQEEIEDLYSGKNITDGQVAYWPFNEGEECTAFDKSGNENDGTLIPNCPDNSPNWELRE